MREEEWKKGRKEGKEGGREGESEIMGEKGKGLRKRERERERRGKEWKVWRESKSRETR